MTLLQFQPISSMINPEFWFELTKLKLNEYKLDDSFRELHATLQDNRLVLDRDVWNNNGLKGMLKNFNTLDEFKTKAKEVLDTLTKEIWNDINDPNQIPHWLLLSFADIKNYKYYYWFVFPAFLPKNHPVLIETFQGKDYFEDWDKIIDSAKDLNQNEPYLLYNQSTSSFKPIDNTTDLKDLQDNVITLLDSSSTINPGWTLRNLLMYLKVKGFTQCTILAFRGNDSKVLKIDLPSDVYTSSTYNLPQVVGWEKNSHNQLGPRIADLSPMMNPEKLSSNAVDLNLKLMRWRLLPQLDLEKIKRQKCLILGAGTLGCYLARGLMAWGVESITFVDYGVVSHSNPVRQPLYEFTDVGKSKVEAACNSLKRIFPGVDCKGFQLNIPMPGHYIVNEEKTRQDYESLLGLISENDVVFLGTDSRESRWLPTLLSKCLGKGVINVALGFDNFLVMRHSTSSSLDIGCYFCNDVVAPRDSLQDRTLDQQCTVTRPGLAPMASSFAVEMCMSILNHPLEWNVSPPKPPLDLNYDMSGKNVGILGVIPHQMRFFLPQFTNLVLSSQRFNQCIACSDAVLNGYKQDEWNFIKHALQDPNWLEEVSGVAQMKRETEEAQLDWDIEEEDFEDL